MPRKSAKSRKEMRNKNRHVKGSKCQSVLLCDSQSVNQDDILLMEELAKAHIKTIETQASSNEDLNLDPEQHVSVGGSVEDVADSASEASTDVMGSQSDCNITNQVEVPLMEWTCQDKEVSTLNAESESLISKEDCAGDLPEGASEASADTWALHQDSSNCSVYLEAGRGVNIVSVSGHDDEGHRFQLDEAALAEVLARPGVADLPVVVVSVAGAFRGGKSFLMGFLLRYLYAQARGAEDWLGGADEPLAGFSWRGGCERETTGLVLWSQPVPITLPSGERVAVLLLDSQGAFDAQSSLRDSSLVFALSTLLSSMQLYNLSRRIGEDDLQHLQVFTEYAALGGALPALTLLVRDWTAPYEYPFGAAGGADYLRDKLMVKPEQPRELREVRARLASSFERLDCFLLAHPGLRAAQDPAFQGRLDEVSEEFKQSLRELVPGLLAPARLRVKRAGGAAVRARDVPAVLRAFLAEFERAGTTPRSILSASATAAWLVGAAGARAGLARAAPGGPRARPALARLLRAARDAALAPLAPLAQRAAQEQALADLEQELDEQIIRLTEENEVKIEVAVARARAAFEEAARELERRELCVSRAALAAALVRARARGAAGLATAGPGDLPERALLDQELEERAATLLPRLTATNDANNEAALEHACAALRGALPAAPCAQPADLALAHAAARRAALAAWSSRREDSAGTAEPTEPAEPAKPADPAEPAEPDDDEYWTRLQNCIDDLLQRNKLRNIMNNRKTISAAISLYKTRVNLDRGCWIPPQLDSKNQEGYKAAMEHFYSCREGPNSRETDDYVKDLESKLINIYNDLRAENKRQNTAAVAAALKVFNDTMDASVRGALKLAAPKLAGMLNDAFQKGKRDFFSKRANSSSTCLDDDYWNLLEKGMVDRFDHYVTKNGDNLTGPQMAVALGATGLVLGGAMTGGAWLVAAAASRVGFNAAVGIGAALLGLLKK